MIDATRPPGAPEEREAERRKVFWIQVGLIVVLVAVLIACYELFEHRNGRRLVGSPPVQVTGVAESRVVPDVALTGESGRPTSLAALRGKVVVLAPFLTLCPATCAATTTALGQLQRDISAAGLSGRVAFLEATVDPARDTPARLRAFSHLTGASSSLVTGAPAELATMWRFFGLSYQPARGGGVPATDWQTGKAVPSGVAYANALYFIGPGGRLRIAMFDPPSTAPGVRAAHLLALEGLAPARPPKDGWTTRQAIGNIEYLLNKRIPVPR
ncbi:MAG: SCO family protein [Acidimicrobiales bacterium]